MNKKWKYGLPLAVLVVAVLVGGKILSIQKDSTKTPARSMAVQIATAEAAAKLPQLLLNGTVEGEISAVVSAKIAGRISVVLAEDGAMVQAGQELLRLESVELANAVRISQETVRRAQASHDNAQADYRRYALLYEQHATSRQQLDGAEMRLKIAQADLSSAAAALDSAQEQYRYAAVTAPVTGLVANRKATVGQVVAAGTPLMTVEQMDVVYAVVDVEQKDMGNLQLGMKAEVSLDAYPGQRFSGQVAVINPVAAATNRLFRVKVKLDNGQFKLKPGMFVQVAIAVGEETTVLTVPQRAVVQKQGLSYVFVIDDGRAVRRPVELGQLLGDKVEIRSGLERGRPVAVTNVNILKDGDAVAVQP